MAVPFRRGNEALVRWRAQEAPEGLRPLPITGSNGLYQVQQKSAPATAIRGGDGRAQTAYPRYVEDMELRFWGLPDKVGLKTVSRILILG